MRAGNTPVWPWPCSSWPLQLREHGDDPRPWPHPQRDVRATGFPFAIEDNSRQIDVLAGHNFGKPLASRKAGTLEIVDGDDAVTFEARLPDDPPSWVIDAERAIAAGLMTGLSPGFTVPPASAVPDAERLENEPGNPGVQIRVIREAVLREFSVVTAPAYADAVVDLRNDHPTPGHNRRRRIWL